MSLPARGGSKVRKLGGGADDMGVTQHVTRWAQRCSVQVWRGLAPLAQVRRLLLTGTVQGRKRRGKQEGRVPDVVRLQGAQGR